MEPMPTPAEPDGGEHMRMRRWAIVQKLFFEVGVLGSRSLFVSPRTMEVTACHLIHHSRNTNLLMFFASLSSPRGDLGREAEHVVLLHQVLEGFLLAIAFQHDLGLWEG